MKKTLLILFVVIVTACNSSKTTINQETSDVLKTGDIMEMNSEAFLIQNNTWKSKTTKHFRFFFDKTIDKKFQKKIIKVQEKNYKEIAELMGIRKMNFPKINFWLFKDKAQKGKLTLVKNDAHAISTFPSVYYLPKNAIGAQEVGHVMTQSYWGFIPKTSNYALVLDEGFNYYVDNARFYKEKIIDRVKKLNEKTPVSIEDIVKANNGKRIKGVQTGSHEIDESLVSGAFVEFIIQKYGIDKFVKLWKKAVTSKNADATIFKEIYGKNIAALNQEFLAILK